MKKIKKDALVSYSQIADIGDSEFRPKACGAAALATILSYQDVAAPPVPDQILARGIDIGAYVEEIGWLHKELAELARSYGVYAHDEDWSGDPNWASWEHCEDALNRGPIIASVRASFSPSKSSHLVTVALKNKKNLYVWDPNRANRDEVQYEVPVDYFQKHWTGRLICVHPDKK